MKKFLYGLKRSGVLLLGLAGFAGCVAAIPFICGAASTVGGAVLGSIGSFFAGGTILSMGLFGQMFLNIKADDKKRAKQQVETKQEYSESEKSAMLTELMALRENKIINETKKHNTQNVEKEIDNEQNLEL